jgi:hypothetical protein
MEEKKRGILITILMILGAIGKTYYLYGDIPRVLSAEIVYPGILIMNSLAVIGIIFLRKRNLLGYLIGASLAFFYIITMLLNIIDVFRGIHQDLPYFLYGPIALIVISIVLIIELYVDFIEKTRKKTLISNISDKIPNENTFK